MAVKNDTFYAEGTVKFDRFDDNDAPTGLIQITGSQSIEIKSNSKILTDSSKDEGKRGMPTAMVSEKSSGDFTWTVKGFDRSKMSMAMMGKDVTFSAGGGTATAEMVTAALGILVPMAHENITAATVVVTNTGGSTTYVENTDYVIDYHGGYITAKAGGAITAAQSLKLAYIYGAVSGWEVGADTVAQINGRFIFEGKNIAQKRRFRLTVPYLVLTSDKPFNFLDDKLSEFSFKGTPLLQDGETSTHYFRYYD